MFTYQPPAGIDDLAGRSTRENFLNAWHASMSGDFQREIASLPGGNKLLFSEEQTAAMGAEIPVTWNAFPLSLRRQFPDDSLKRRAAADELRALDRSATPAKKASMPFRMQDEYCEWHAYRSNPGGPIQRIVFTAEAPEYWIELARHDFDRVVQLYRQWVSSAVQPDDLKLLDDIEFDGEVLQAGTYNPYNMWNTAKGCMHLTHYANTLGAEINLAARATIPRKDANGQRITDVRRFACASDFGDPNRSSDPNIGSGVNLTVLPAGAVGTVPRSITLANPVALYIDRIAAGVLTDEHDNPLPGWFKIVRGVPGRGLMAVLEPPANAGFGLDKVLIDGEPLAHGGQVAEHIQMVLYAKTADLRHPAPPLQKAIRHCCMPADGKPAEKLNFAHQKPAQTCEGPDFKDAYPELLGVAAGIAPDAASGQKPGRRSRLALPSEPWNV